MTKKTAAVEDLEQKVGELTEALQLERADSTNLRRRHDEQLARLRISAKASVVRDLLPVIDNFERALKHVPGKADSKQSTADSWDKETREWIRGVVNIKTQLEETLAKIGVHKIKTVGEPFDPHLHEAISSEGEGEHEIISEELQSGYLLDDEVIRHAMVRVEQK